MGDAWRAISDDHIKGKGFRRIGILKDKRDFQAIYNNGEHIGYGCTPKCTSIIISLLDINSDPGFSLSRVIVRQVGLTDKNKIKFNLKEVVCSLGCDPYKERFI